MFDAEEIGYRSPVNLTPPKTPDADIDNFSTLEDVFRKFDNSLKDLEHINAFDTLKVEDKKKAAEVLLRQIDAKQLAYEILEPLHAQLKSAIEDIKNVQEGK